MSAEGGRTSGRGPAPRGRGDLRTTTAGSRGARIRVVVDGEPVEGYEGESVAAALLAAGRRTFRFTDRDETPRSYYCGMGVCHDCLVAVDGGWPVSARPATWGASTSGASARSPRRCSDACAGWRASGA